ncbi:MAG: hypothetical protein IPH80_23750 [Myxococcales bacterium]|nr:hypothetical protein [Myxococcales bacterium]MBP6846845.1 hypothetical protein [Kofleriaceae bacterium]
MSLESAISDADRDPATLDERGLVPLAEARATIAATTVVDRDNLDAVWAALCSLGDGAELATAAAHLDWQMPPRGKANVAFVERYGAGALAWLRTRVGNGVLTNHPWCVLPCVMELDDPGALDLLLDVDGVLADGGSMTAWVFSRAPVPDDRAALDAAALDLVLAWTRRHPDVAYPRLAARARTSARAAAALRALAAKAPTDVAARLAAVGEGGLVAALDLPTAVSIDAILAELGAASEQSWPVFHANVDGRLEYFGQRVIAVRAPQGDGWAIVFERMQGSDPDMFQIARYAYGPYTTNGLDFDQFHGLDFELAGEDDAPVFRGSIATGPAGALRIDESIFARHDLRPGRNTEHGSWSARAIAIRAYLAEHPGCYWPPADEALGASGLPDGEVLFVADAYQHPCYAAADEDEHPWQIGVAESPVMRSLIDAVIARDPARFEPGDSNLDWRLHAVCASEFALPWTEYHVDTSAGFVAAAMRQAGEAVDDRGLMPLAEAQAICATATSLARGEGRYVGDAWVWDHDRVWAALLSLPTAAAAAAVFGRLDLADGPRSAAANRALAERYGDGALAIVASRARADGVIAAPTPLLRTTVLAVGTPAGFRFVWDTTGWDEAGGSGTPDEQASALFAAWVAAHPQVGFVELGRLAAGGDAAALAFLQTWGAPQARRVFGWLRDALGAATAGELYARAGLIADLAPSHVLACLDHWAAQDDDAWPRFATGAGPSREYHALRLIAARAVAGDDWVVVIERLEGYGGTLKIQRYAYADDLPCGLKADAAVALTELGHALGERYAADPADAGLCELPDYWTKIDGAPAQVARVRALLRDPAATVWPAPAAAVAAVGRADAEVIVVATAFAHTQGPPYDEPPPSATSTFATLAQAIVARAAAAFTAGESNLDPRAHVRAEEEAADEDHEAEEDAEEATDDAEA